MGDYADMMMDGLLCIRCGGVVAKSIPGHPRMCGDCARDARDARAEQQQQKTAGVKRQPAKRGRR